MSQQRDVTAVQIEIRVHLAPQAYTYGQFKSLWRPVTALNIEHQRHSDRLHGITSRSQTRPNCHKLTATERQTIVRYILDLDLRGFAPRLCEVADMADKMLVHQQQSLISHIRKKYDQAGKIIFENINAWVALSGIITNILQDPSLSTTYLIIDALDECVAGLPKLLAFIAQQSIVPSRVIWIASSCNWPDIEEQLNKAGQKVKLHLELNTESISTAVGIYIQHKTEQLVKLKRYDEKTPTGCSTTSDFKRELYLILCGFGVPESRVDPTMGDL